MKKLLLLTIVVSMAICAGAQPVHNLGKPSSKANAKVEIITEQPEGNVVSYTRSGEYLTVSLYGYDATQQTGQMKITYADDGKTVYLLDPLAYGEGTGVWVQGELSDDGSTITVPLGQYVAYNETYEYGLILAWGETTLIDLGDDFYWLMFEPEEGVDAVTYAVDAENGTITLVGSEGDASADYPNNLLAHGLAGIWSDDASIATIEWGTTFTPLSDAVPAVPANPEALDFFDCGNESGYTRFDFNINLQDVDGNELHADLVTYSIYTDDDQLFTFDAATYGAANGFDEDMTEIHYGFSGEDFYLRRVYFYRTNDGDNPLLNWRIGIQTHYTVDGVRNSSDIVYLEVIPSGIEGVQSGKTVVAERYYNMAGQEIANPAGIAIKVTTYSDGTTSATKVVK
ncbi:MAG: hypothetical protein IKW83_09005 [Muribaculaceae bacterium]|nr:hypothetical protein [Muribaculaceae bacterium]